MTQTSQLKQYGSIRLLPVLMNRVGVSRTSVPSQDSFDTLGTSRPSFVTLLFILVCGTFVDVFRVLRKGYFLFVITVTSLLILLIQITSINSIEFIYS